MRQWAGVVTLVWLLLCGSNSNAQTKPDSSIFSQPIQMDEVVIKAAKNGWDIGAFVQRVKADTTFYKAFRSLHVVNYSAVNDICFLDKKGKTEASLYSKTKQMVVNRCRSMQTLEEKTTGKFYKKGGDYRYYTAGLYAYLFFTKGTICNEHDIVAGMLTARSGGGLGKAKWELKQLMFNPGSKISGIPFIGNRASLFDDAVAAKYDFSLTSETLSGEDCYVFKAVPKAQYTDDVVYKEFVTWFRKRDYAIVARNYALAYSTLFYDFDVTMKVQLETVNGRLLPASIQYDGNWRVATKGRERCRFMAQFRY